jgi:hypothetical protein
MRHQRRHSAAGGAAPPLTAEALAFDSHTYTLPGLLISSHYDSDIGLVG